jgi:hypothetical protein
MAGQVLLDGWIFIIRRSGLPRRGGRSGSCSRSLIRFPARSVYDNVVAGLKLTGVKAGEPCSALDPTSTRVIEGTIAAEEGTLGCTVEHGASEAMFKSPQDPRTADYVNGRYG